MHNAQAKPSGFHAFGLAPALLAAIDRLGFTQPTPIQERTIPLGLEGKDVVGLAQTGTGKTLAFGLPMIERLRGGKGQGLILVPTRELALQVDETLRSVGNVMGLRTAVVIGGASMSVQIHRLRQNPHVIIATPGRLIDHIQQKNVNFISTRIIVLDEADRMFDIGFAPQIKQILALIPADCQKMLFSATMPSAIAQIATKFMRSPIRVEVTPSGTPVAHIAQSVYIMDKRQKIQMVEKILKETEGTVLLFSRTKHGARNIADAVRNMGHTAVEIHSNRSLGQRTAAMRGFKSGAFRVLVATDIAARGIDVTGIGHVINFDLPDNSEDYVHRIGRTGRAGLKGIAISFATHDERNAIRDIERLMRTRLDILPLPALPPLPPRPVHSVTHHHATSRTPYRRGSSEASSYGPAHRSSHSASRTSSHTSHSHSASSRGTSSHSTSSHGSYARKPFGSSSHSAGHNTSSHARRSFGAPRHRTGR